MKTNQVMETQDRILEGEIVRQRTKDSFFALNDILAVLDFARLKDKQTRINFSLFLQTDSVKEFLAELERQVGIKPYIKGVKGKTGWVHPFFALKILTHFNPKFEVRVYQWLWDYLIQNRIDSGDSYNKMCGVLYNNAKNKGEFGKNLPILANKIKKIIGVEDWNKASQEQLKLRDYAHNMIADLSKTLRDSQRGSSLGLGALADKVGESAIKNTSIQADREDLF